MFGKKNLILFVIGGLLYIIIELLWRGYTHTSMFVIGGICFVLMGLINEFYTFDMLLAKQMLISSLTITIIEFLAGLVLNIYLGLNVWDYSNLRFNIIGQVCLLYSTLWFFISLPAIILDDYLRYWLFNEEKPRYKILGGLYEL